MLQIFLILILGDIDERNTEVKWGTFKIYFRLEL